MGKLELIERIRLVNFDGLIHGYCDIYSQWFTISPDQSSRSKKTVDYIGRWEARMACLDLRRSLESAGFPNHLWFSWGCGTVVWCKQAQHGTLHYSTYTIIICTIPINSHATTGNNLQQQACKLVIIQASLTVQLSGNLVILYQLPHVHGKMNVSSHFKLIDFFVSRMLCLQLGSPIGFENRWALLVE